MLHDGLKLHEGSSIINLTVPSGIRFPVAPNNPPNDGEFFLLTADILDIDGITVLFSPALYMYSNNAWEVVGTGSRPLRYNEVIAIPSAVWNIAHNLGYLPVIQCILDDGSQIIPADVTHTDENNVVVSFTSPKAGSVTAI